MCGISGIISSENISKDLLNSIRNLEYRGYDSCGLAVFDSGKIQVLKNTGTVDEVNSKERFEQLEGSIGIAHTRWATHGGVTQANSHPHLSGNNQFVIVHNGIFSNYQELKDELKEKGVHFRSMTDSEVFAHLIEKSFEDNHGVEEAFVQALNKVEGSFATAMLCTHDSDHIYCAKKDSPLILGIGEGRNFIGSDINGFLEYTKHAITLDDGDYAIVGKDNYLIKSVQTKEPFEKYPFIVDWDVETTKKGGYPHFMLKEIFDQPFTAKQVLKISSEEIRQMALMIHQARHCFLVGVGTTYYVALLAQYLFAEFAKYHTTTISSDEFQGMAILSDQDIVLTVSQSGETYDTKMAVSYAKSFGAKTAAVVNVMGSSICMMVDNVIMQGSGAEICVVSTKAAFAQMLVLFRVVLDLALNNQTISRNEYDEYYMVLNAFPDIIETTLNEQSGFLRNLAREMSRVHNWLFLGCGIYYPVAMESALKMKEVTYLHAEGMSAGFLKHGTLAMIDESLHSLFFIPPVEMKDLHQRTLVAIEEINARGGKVIGIGFDGDKKAEGLLNHMIKLPKVHPILAPLLELIMAQLFSYYTALELGRNIDKPRNLAKSVTVA